MGSDNYIAMDSILAIRETVVSTAAAVECEHTVPIDVDELIRSSMEKAFGTANTLDQQRPVNDIVTTLKDPASSCPNQTSVHEMEEARLLRMRQMKERGDEEDEEVRRLINGPAQTTDTPRVTSGNGIPVINLRPGFDHGGLENRNENKTLITFAPTLPGKPGNISKKAKKRAAALQRELASLNKDNKRRKAQEEPPCKKPKRDTGGDVSTQVTNKANKSQTQVTHGEGNANVLASVLATTQMTGNTSRQHNNGAGVSHAENSARCYNVVCMETHLRLKVLEANIQALEAEKRAISAERAEFEARVRVNDAQNIIHALNYRMHDAEARQRQTEAELLNRIVVLEEFCMRGGRAIAAGGGGGGGGGGGDFQANVFIRGGSTRSYSEPNRFS